MRLAWATSACVRTVPKPHPRSPVPRLDLLALAQRRQANRQNEHYVALRAQAAEAGAVMAHCFEESQAAYAKGYRAQAKDLSLRGRSYQRYMEACNRRASEWIYAENNKVQREEVDLHGLYVKEAVSYAQLAILKALVRGEREVHLVVGRGFFSEDGLPRLRPAVAELMHELGLDADRDPTNAGVLVVHLDGQSGMFRRHRAADWTEDNGNIGTAVQGSLA